MAFLGILETTECSCTYLVTITTMWLDIITIPLRLRDREWKVGVGQGQLLSHCRIL